MRTVAGGVVVLLLAAPVMGQGGGLGQVPAPDSVPVVEKVPLEPGLVMDIVWASLSGRVGGTVYRCTVETVDGGSVQYRAGRGNPLHTIDNRLDCEYYTGNWSETQDDQLPHTWPWISLVAAQQLAEGTIGETTVALGDLLAGEMREYLLVGQQALACASEGQPIMVPCWLLVSGNGATMCVMADPENPVVLESWEPGRSMQRALDIRGVEIAYVQ